MKKRIIILSILGFLFLVSLTCSFILDYEAVDIITLTFGVSFGLVFDYIVCIVIIEHKIKTYGKKIEEEVLSNNPDALDDIKRYTYYGYQYALDSNKAYSPEEFKKIRTSYIIMGAYNIYDSKNLDEKKKSTLLKVKVIDFYINRKENRFKQNFFYDKNEYFFGWGISIILALLGISLFIISSIIYNSNKVSNYNSSMILAIFGLITIFPCSVRLSLLLGLK